MSCHRFSISNLHINIIIILMPMRQKLVPKCARKRLEISSSCHYSEILIEFQYQQTHLNILRSCTECFTEVTPPPPPLKIFVLIFWMNWVILSTLHFSTSNDFFLQEMTFLPTKKVLTSGQGTLFLQIKLP